MATVMSSVVIPHAEALQYRALICDMSQRPWPNRRGLTIENDSKHTRRPTITLCYTWCYWDKTLPDSAAPSRQLVKLVPVYTQRRWTMFVRLKRRELLEAMQPWMKHLRPCKRFLTVEEATEFIYKVIASILRPRITPCLDYVHPCLLENTPNPVFFPHILPFRDASTLPRYQHIPTDHLDYDHLESITISDALYVEPRSSTKISMDPLEDDRSSGHDDRIMELTDSDEEDIQPLKRVGRETEIRSNDPAPKATTPLTCCGKLFQTQGEKK